MTTLRTTRRRANVAGLLVTRTPADSSIALTEREKDIVAKLANVLVDDWNLDWPTADIYYLPSVQIDYGRDIIFVARSCEPAVIDHIVWRLDAYQDLRRPRRRDPSERVELSKELRSALAAYEIHPDKRYPALEYLLALRGPIICAALPEGLLSFERRDVGYRR